MPIVKIDILKGNSKDFNKHFLDSVHDSMIEILMIPKLDRNQRLIEYEQDYFYSKPPYEYFIEIIMFCGRSKETKRQLFKSIVENLNTRLKINPEKVFILINEQPLENWGVRGGVSAVDIKFDFDINI